MRIAQSGHVTVTVPAAAPDVIVVLADADEVAAFVAPLLDDRSTGDRWVVEPVRLGPVVVRPVADVTVTRTDDEVTVTGVPVPGTTRTWLSVVMAVTPGDGTCTVTTDWEVRVDLPGPQFVARLARPLLEAEARTVTRDLTTRLVNRFVT